MVQQIPVSEHIEVGETDGDGTTELDPTLACRRLAIVNVVLHGPPLAGPAMCAGLERLAADFQEIAIP